MAKRKRDGRIEREKAIARGRRIREERGRRLRAMSDAELATAYQEALDAYIERAEYFDSLPSWMLDEFRRIHELGPAAYGLTEAEWLQLCADRLEHIVEGDKLGGICAERRRRLREAARKAVSTCADIHASEAEAVRYSLPEGPWYHFRADGETVREYVLREEHWQDMVAEGLGAGEGWLEAFDEHQRREVERICVN